MLYECLFGNFSLIQLHNERERGGRERGRGDREIPSDRYRNMQADKQTDEWTDRQAAKRTGRQAEKLGNRQTKGQR